LEVVKEEYDRDKIIAGCGDNGKEILEKRFAEYTEDYEEEEWEDMLGEETEGEELHQFIGYISFSDGMLEADTLLLEIPVKHPWEIIGYLPMGGWNRGRAFIKYQNWRRGWQNQTSGISGGTEENI
jgi:hypothetical protein